MLNDRAIFTVYQTQDQLVSAGIHFDAYNPALPLKSWADPNPPAADDEGNVLYSVLATTPGGIPKLKDGKPYLTTLRITRETAMRYNIPGTLHNSDYPIKAPGNIATEVAVPIHGPADDEEFHIGFGGLITIIKKAASVVAPGAPADLTSVLNAIADLAAKVDLLLAMK